MANSNPTSIVSMICWKSEGTTFKPKGSQFNLNKPLCLLIVRYLEHSSSILTCKYASIFKRNLQQKHTEFLLRLMVTMLCWKQHAEISLDASKIMILMLKIMNALVHQKSLKMKTWRRHYFMKTHVRCKLKLQNHL